MSKQSPPPLIGIPCCRRQVNETPFHAVAEKYVTAITDTGGALPLLIPALGPRLDIDQVVDRVDGLLITGSPSNVEPHHYAGPPSVPGTAHDPERDATTLPLIRRAIERGVPVLAICRGIQELNVALGGSLHQRLYEVPGRLDHRTPKGPPVEIRYAHQAHPVRLTPGGLLHRLAGVEEVIVNSLHSQGIDQPAQGLVVEAVAPDGQIEAVRLPGPVFVVGVQWHPEFAVREHPFSLQLFEAFAKAYATRAQSRGARVGKAA
jgi:putative glutamine amidotransferase